MVSERWTAAVELQRRAAVELDVLPLGDLGDARMVSLVDAATIELHRAWRDSGARTDEWSAAYGLHRAAMIRRRRRSNMHAAVTLAAQVAEGARNVWPMAVVAEAIRVVTVNHDPGDGDPCR